MSDTTKRTDDPQDEQPVTDEALESVAGGLTIDGGGCIPRPTIIKYPVPDYPICKPTVEPIGDILL
jgi:hypothetical protein